MKILFNDLWKRVVLGEINLKNYPQWVRLLKDNE